MNITVENFVFLLWNAYCRRNEKPVVPEENISSILHYGHVRGWLEDQDEVFPKELVNKRTAARILHQFMKLELSIPDLENIQPAYVLKDLFSCHVCVNHVAQIYLRGIMEKEEIDNQGKTEFIFNMLRVITRSETQSIINSIM